MEPAGDCRLFPFVHLKEGYMITAEFWLGAFIGLVVGIAFVLIAATVS